MALPILYASTLFFSAALLFSVQPMIGKLLLPLLGGAPAVWNTCMVFFQAALLAGYTYAHASTRWLGPRRQAILHAALLLTPLFVLPIGIASDAAPPVETNPIPWLLGRLAAVAGVPFVLVATSAPLLQRWFAASRHGASADPYFLYAASNLGSLVALLAYPLAIEPFLSLAVQSRLWAIGYAVLVLMTWLCAGAMLRSSGPQAAGAPASNRTSPEPPRSQNVLHADVGARQRMRWVLLAFAPSSLMLGVTSHISTNLAAVPLLWVVPLALYLLTYVLAFARRPPLSHVLTARLLPLVAIVAAPLFFASIPGLEWQAVLVHLALFFMAAMACHGRLAAERPAAERLTQYYLWISVGGVLGGVFNAIAAPLIFRTVVEYPLAVVLACLLRPADMTATTKRRAFSLDLIVPGALAVAAFGAVMVLQITRLSGTWSGLAIVYALVGTVGVVVRGRPVRAGLSLAVGMAALGLYTRLGEGRTLHVERDFFGVKRVMSSADGGVHILYHGTTLHGVQQTSPQLAREPLAYYHRGGPVGDVFSAVVAGNPQARVAVVGLGAGATAAYAEPGQSFTFYEIDPAVARIASEPRFFTYLRTCRGAHEIVLGDGRLTLARSPDGAYDLIFLDAYGSDAIPTHLLTREALRLYRSKLAARGLLAFHITNRFLDLETLLGALAADAGLACFVKAESDADLSDSARAAGAAPASVAVLAQSTDGLAPLRGRAGWRGPAIRPGARAWTDEYSNLLGIMRWQ